MLLLFLISALTFVTRTYETTNQTLCDGIIFQQVYYDKEVLVTNLGRPYNLVLHKYTGDLFFSHTIHTGTQVDFGIMACHVDSKKCYPVDGVPGGYAIGYDSAKDDLYFGGHNGIYKYNFVTKKAEFFAEEGKSIWGIFVKSNFYYIEYPTQRLYVYRRKKFVQVAKAIGIEILIFFISKKLEIYFSNKTALYKVDKVSKLPIVLNDEIITRQIVEDNYGDVYFCADDGIYIEESPFHRVKRAAYINQGFGMTFDEHERIIYSDRNSIYILNPSSDSEFCYDKLFYNSN
ncbi:unnamed protein product [Parnassius mnemosyne]|uniref:Ommochrome-binding protein-like n=1 Tax=Parnassius mnemosyne TaxID=213953 RepID=A0AAV1LH78_9NEOP